MPERLQVPVLDISDFSVQHATIRTLGLTLSLELTFRNLLRALEE